MIFGTPAFAAKKQPTKVKPKPFITAKRVTTETAIPTNKVVVLYMAYPLREHPFTGEMYKPSGLCSGFFIGSNGQVMTAAHCVDDPEIESVEVVTSDKKRYKAKIVTISGDSDIALLKIARKNTPHFELAKTVKQGEEIYTLGHPLRQEYTLTKGIVAKLKEKEQKKTLVDMTVLPGNSGGAVYNREGKLVGVASAGFIVLFGTTGLNLIVSRDQISEFLDLFKGI